MKYIRTKDGHLLDMTVFDVDINGYLFYKNEPDIFTIYSKKDIIKQADTIEELCDAVVVFQPPIFKPYICLDTFSNIKKYYEGFSDWKRFIIKCAIWTDKGLIYVAKMNDKGELELL